MHPDPFTLAELYYMAEAKNRQMWQHTSMILALLANIHRDPRKHRAFKPSDFNPYANYETKQQPITISMQDLKTILDSYVGISSSN